MKPAALRQQLPHPLGTQEKQPYSKRRWHYQPTGGLSFQLHVGLHPYSDSLIHSSHTAHTSYPDRTTNNNQHLPFSKAQANRFSRPGPRISVKRNNRPGRRHPLPVKFHAPRVNFPRRTYAGPLPTETPNSDSACWICICLRGHGRRLPANPLFVAADVRRRIPEPSPRSSAYP
jgi:hypothetical protein